MTPSVPSDLGSPTRPCPCGSGQNFAECCGPILSRARPADSAERLMRSRFTAHTLHDFEHLHRTYLSTAHRPYVSQPDDGVPLKWTRLQIHSHEPGSKPDVAFVDFTAFHRDADGEHALHEKSEFIRVGGEWFYSRAVRQGPAPQRSTSPKIGRNDPCTCGSGKKFKHCCGR